MLIWDMASLSIVIITKNRPQLLTKCLESLLQQQVKPFEIIIIEDITDNKPTRLTSYKKRFKQQHIYFHQQTVKYNNYALSRNKGLALARATYLVFIDDDIVLKPDSLKKVLHFHTRKPQAIIQTGIFFPVVTSNIWGEFDCAYMNWTNNFLKNPKLLSFAPTAFMSIKRRFVTQRKIKFNSDLYTCEDWEFCFEVKKNGGKIYANPSLHISHHFRVSPIPFFKRHLEYSFGNIEITRTGIWNEDWLRRWLPIRRRHVALLPLFICERIYLNTLKNLEILRLSKKYFLPALLDTITVACSIYFSRFGIKKVLRSSANTLPVMFH